MFQGDLVVALKLRLSFFENHNMFFLLPRVREFET